MLDPDKTLTQLERVINDPIEWLKCVRTIDQVDKVNPIKHFPWHLEYVQLYVRVWEIKRLLLSPKSRRMKMTWLNIALYTWDTLFHRGRYNAFVSKKEDDADVLVQKADFIIKNIDQERLPKKYIPKHETTFNKLKVPDMDSALQGFPSGSDQLRQFTFSGIFGDEMAFWDNAEEMYSAAFPTLEGGGRFTGVSSAAPGFFKALCYDKLDESDEQQRTG